MPSSAGGASLSTAGVTQLLSLQLLECGAAEPGMPGNSNSAGSVHMKQPFPEGEGSREGRGP